MGPKVRGKVFTGNLGLQNLGMHFTEGNRNNSVWWYVMISEDLNGSERLLLFQ